MSGRILIVEPIATNRILIRSMLEAARYEVSGVNSASELQARIAEFRPDVILMDFSSTLAASLALCSSLTRVVRGPGSLSGPLGPEPTGMIPVIALVKDVGSAARVSILQAGAVDIFEKPANPARLLARIRSVLRARDAQAELCPETGPAVAFSFAEERAPYMATPSLVSVLTQRADRLAPICQRLKDRGIQCQVHPSPTRLPPIQASRPPDLFVIDSAGGGVGPGDLFRLLADLRSQSDSRHAAQLVILPPGANDLAVLALDLGANDLVSETISAAELDYRIDALLRQKAASDRLRENVRNGLEAAITDPLTGLFNRRYALSEISVVARAALRRQGTFAAMILDIDHFKAINDTYGHAAGDRVLVGVADRLKAEMRADDFVARIGGEEFLVVLRDSTLDEARVTAERLRQTVGSKGFDLADARHVTDPNTTAGVEVTLSVGVAIGGGDCQTEAGIRALYDRADSALYAAKTAGRNQVTLSSSAA